jgi:hypothetical protein
LPLKLQERDWIWRAKGMMFISTSSTKAQLLQVQLREENCHWCKMLLSLLQGNYTMGQKRLNKHIVVGIPLFSNFLAPQPDLHRLENLRWG